MTWHIATRMALRLSDTHGENDHSDQICPDLEHRVDRHVGRLTPERSLVFFYFACDDPISADDRECVLLGCARLSDAPSRSDFPYDAAEPDANPASAHMQSFPPLHSAQPLSHDGANTAVQLPYRGYLDHIADHPEDRAKLAELRVVIDEPALLCNFEHAPGLLHDDHALVLLYKLKRALARAQAHGIIDVDATLERIDDFIADAWHDRGPYPGLGSVLNVLADLAERKHQTDSDRGAELAAALRASLADGEDLLDAVFSLLASSGVVPPAFASYGDTARDARAGYLNNKGLKPLLRKLALFSLSPRQVKRILFPDRDGPHTFASLALSADDIATNPYVLAESYVPSSSDVRDEQVDHDRERRTDTAIDYALIDIGMFPDHRHIDRREDLHDLTVSGPERLRAFAHEALRAAEAQGNNFVSTASLAEYAAAHPLMFRDKLRVTDARFRSDAHLAHFRERMHIERGVLSWRHQ